MKKVTSSCNQRSRLFKINEIDQRIFLTKWKNNLFYLFAKPACCRLFDNLHSQNSKSCRFQRPKPKSQAKNSYHFNIKHHKSFIKSQA
jgi:hypothetical protein